MTKLDKNNGLTIGVIGIGHMGSALVRGIVRAGLVESDHLTVYDSDPARRKAIVEEAGVRAVDSNVALLKASQIVILAVIPQKFSEVLDEIAPAATTDHLFITPAAGISTASVAHRLGEGTRVTRVMPNIPALIDCGAAAVAAGADATRDDMENTLKIFRAVGTALEVEEDMMNAVTGLSGSGPAYVFYLLECLTHAGVKAGLSPETAAALTRQTFLGAVLMVQETGIDPAELRRRVTSRHGTTEAGLAILTQANFEDLVARTVARAAQRSAELSAELSV